MFSSAHIFISRSMPEGTGPYSINIMAESAQKINTAFEAILLLSCALEKFAVRPKTVTWMIHAVVEQRRKPRCRR